jgi:hypothetical protein
MRISKIELAEEELDLILDALSLQFKYNYSSKIESLMIKIDEKREAANKPSDAAERPSVTGSLEIYKTLIASTSHVEQEDLDKLASFPEIFLLHDHHYGTRIYLAEDLLHEICNVPISEGLRMLILFAVSHDCGYLELDSDGPKYEGFPQYEW